MGWKGHGSTASKQSILKAESQGSAELQKLNIELVVLAGFLSILDRELVKAYEGRIINIHPSLIPSFCGMGFYGERVHKAALEYGVKVSGATVHFVDEGTDSGPIILQEAVPVYLTILLRPWLRECFRWNTGCCRLRLGCFVKEGSE